MPEVIINNKKAFYSKTGNGKPSILLVHGWSSKASKSLGKLQKILSRKFTTIALDLPGFGESDNPDPDWGVYEYAEFISKFIKRLESEKIIYFGHSFGGALGVVLAVKYPDLFEKIILCAASYKRHNTQRSSMFLNTKPFPLFFRKFFYRIFFPDSDILKIPKLESNFRKVVTQDLTSMSKNIRIDTMILWGEKDTQTPIEKAKLLQSNIKNSYLFIKEKGSHSLPYECFEWVAKKIEEFIQ